MQDFLQKLRKQANKIILIVSKSVNSFIKFGGSLLGVYHSDGMIDSASLVLAGWVYLIGCLIGIIIFGNTFSLASWMIVLLIVIFISNLDEACNILKAQEVGNDRN